MDHISLYKLENSLQQSFFYLLTIEFLVFLSSRVTLVDNAFS